MATSQTEVAVPAARQAALAATVAFRPKRTGSVTQPVARSASTSFR
ncbi:MAG: hypothetical protein U0599_17735 [Vicinamibacteria bacterium]